MGEAYLVELFEGDTHVQTLEEPTQADAMHRVVKFLVSNRALLQKIELPYGTGVHRALISESPVHKDGSDMIRYRELQAGVYVCTRDAKEKKQRQIQHLVKLCGLKADFQGKW